MKIKTSITLSEDLLRGMERFQMEYPSRSAFLEEAARKMLARLEREAAERRDLEIIDKHADRLNEEAEDVLSFQEF